ncbi:hypothetical protein GCM10008956_18350 [Deinococcus arenae]|uniref:Secreted protein n=1 Tax=Deinococcus arenae TaxID=1452751 RepID=A0A8H9L681_9DEIO|nr:hypothetical protein [Deinococcus arenae]AWT36592.1 hypothetical protein DM785_14305 [Deinococcus actinosclerus]GGM42278.1 hypothetical protein GCM10008956_18350 [Deinococcus arenae]
MSLTRVRLAAALFLASVPLASAAGFSEASFAQVGAQGGAGVWKPVRFWCDTPGRVLALSGAGAGAGTLTQWVGGARSQVGVTVGADDPGAGQVYTPLTFAGRAAQAPGFFVHSSNVENVQDPAYRLTHISEFRVPAGSFACRYVPQAAVLAATAKHSVIVWDAGGKVTYASRNRDGTPGVMITGGTRATRDGRTEYRWNRGGYGYVLTVGLAGHAGGELRVERAGRTLSRESLLAYSVSTPR